MDMDPAPAPSAPIDVSIDDTVSPSQVTSDTVDAMACRSEERRVGKECA